MKHLLAYLVLFILVSNVSADLEDYKKDRMLFDRVCNACHGMDMYLWPRTYKGWQLTVENMKNYCYDDKAFSDTEADRITKFLAAYAGEGELMEFEGKPEEEFEEPEKSEVVEKAAVSETPPSAPPVRVRAIKKLWNPSRGALRMARVSGFAAVVFLLGLIFSGVYRKKLKKSFRPLHVKLALGLFVSLAVHGVIYIAEYGTPSVLWYWFGLIGFTALIITEVQGIVRKRFRKGLLISHIAGACIGLMLSILHWVWAWL